MNIQPYYRDDSVIILHGDCREIVPHIKPSDFWPEAGEKFDLLLTDPPYGIFKKSGGDGKMFGAKTIYSSDDSASKWDKKPDAVTLSAVMGACEKFAIWGGELYGFNNW